MGNPGWDNRKGGKDFFGRKKRVRRLFSALQKGENKEVLYIFSSEKRDAMKFFRPQNEDINY